MVMEFDESARILTSREARRVAKAVAVRRWAGRVEALRAELSRVLATCSRRLQSGGVATRSETVAAPLGIAVGVSMLLMSGEGAALSDRSGRFWVVRRGSMVLPAWTVGYAGLLSRRSMQIVSLFRSNNQRSAVMIEADLRSALRLRWNEVGRCLSLLPRGATVADAVMAFPDAADLVRRVVR